MISTPGATISTQCFTEQTADETLGPWIDVRGRSYLVFYQTSTGTTSGGVITFEEAAPRNFNSSEAPVVVGLAEGSYQSITTSNASDSSADKQKAIHITVAGYCFVRARISTAITGGGSISIGLVAH